jgi:hypothetical protein
MPGHSALVGQGVSGIASLLVSMRGEQQHPPEYGTIVINQTTLMLVPDSMPDVQFPPGDTVVGGYVVLQYLALEPIYTTDNTVVTVNSALNGVSISGTSVQHTHTTVQHNHTIPGTELQDGDRVLVLWAGAETAVVIGVLTPRTQPASVVPYVATAQRKVELLQQVDAARNIAELKTILRKLIAGPL